MSWQTWLFLVVLKVSAILLKLPKFWALFFYVFMAKKKHKIIVSALCSIRTKKLECEKGQFWLWMVLFMSMFPILLHHAICSFQSVNLFFYFLSIFRIRTTISSFLKSRATTTSLWMPGKRDTVSKEQPPSTDLSSYAKTSTTWKCPKWSPTTPTGNFMFVSVSCHFSRRRWIAYGEFQFFSWNRNVHL